MSNYYMGVDIGSGDDKTMFSVMRKPNKLEMLMRKLKLSRATWEWKVLGVYSEDDVKLDAKVIKRTYKGVRINE